MFRNFVLFSVNGELVKLQGADVFSPLSDILRYHLRKTGTKVVCAEGDCGACTLLLSRVNEVKGNKIQFNSINSCIYPSFLVDGCHLLTVEGLSRDSNLNEIQQSMVRNFGGQCGFCTPGFVMSLANMFAQKEKPTEKNVKNYLTGNLCRCTGYQPILQAALDVDVQKLPALDKLFALTSLTQHLRKNSQIPIMLEQNGKKYFAPTTLRQATDFKKKNPQTRIFSGATDLGVQINKGKDPGAVQMSLHLIDELYDLKKKNQTVTVGARVTLGRLQTFLEEPLPPFAEFLNIFASPQIKNSATLVGNLANGSPIADTLPVLLSLDATIELAGPRGNRSLPVSEFFKGYKSFNMNKNEIITRLHFPLPDLKKTKIGLYKVSQRKDLDISCVNSSFFLEVNNGSVESAKISYGGVGPTPLRLFAAEKRIKGMALDQDFIGTVKKLILSSISPISDLRGSGQFRELMAGQLFEKFAKEHLGL